jgi:hypothetical protein
MQPHNPMCDGSHCRSDSGPVKVYPLGGGGNLILCRACFNHENAYRLIKGDKYKSQENWPLIDWSEAKPYPEV